MKEIQIEIMNYLVWASAGYAQAGMNLFRGAGGLQKNAQASIGNLAIATEPLIKAFIAKQNLLLLFKDLPLELRCAIGAPEAMPKSFNSMPYKIDLKSSAYKSIDLNEAISTFCIFFPDFKKRFNSHLRFLSQHRNTCVHAVLPDCREYEVERTAFLFLSMVNHINLIDANFLRYRSFGDKNKNESFLSKFDEERLIKVHKKAEEAREKAKNITDKVSLKPEEWNWYPVECPVCGSDGYVLGETEVEDEYDNDGIPSSYLIFNAEAFECEQCGLKLEDYDEMQIAGVKTDDIDRSDEYDKWQEEHYAKYEPW